MYVSTSIRLDMFSTWTFQLSPPEASLPPSLCHQHHHCWVLLRLHGGHHLLEGGSNTNNWGIRAETFSSQKWFSIDCLGFCLMLICVWCGVRSYSMVCGFSVVFECTCANVEQSRGGPEWALQSSIVWLAKASPTRSQLPHMSVASEVCHCLRATYAQVL